MTGLVTSTEHLLNLMCDRSNIYLVETNAHVLVVLTKCGVAVFAAALGIVLVTKLDLEECVYVCKISGFVAYSTHKKLVAYSHTPEYGSFDGALLTLQLSRA